MPANNSQHNQLQQNNGQAPTNSNTVNGIQQAMDPMGGGNNFFDTLSQKSQGGQQQQAAPQMNHQGMPQGADSFPTSQPYQPQQGAAPSPEGGSPMDKWFNKPDNGNNQAAPQQQAAPTAEQPPTPYESIFAKSKIEEYNALMGKNDFTKDLFNDDLAEAFKGGDFSGLPALINAAVQRGGAMASFMSSKVSDKAVSGMFENFQQSQLPELLNSHQLNNMWKDPAFSDFSSPAMQPMVQMATNHVRSMYPQASPQEVQSRAMEMMQDYNKQLSGMQFDTGKPPVNTGPQEDELSAMERLFNR